MLAEQCDQSVPHARIYLEQHRAATVPEVLSAIAFQLGKTYEHYGSLRFPLLAIGIRVIRAELPDERPAARDAVRDLLAAEVDLAGIREILRDAASALKPEVEPYVRVGVGVLLEGARRVIRRARSLNPDWYGHRDRGRPDNPYDVLVDLHFWAREKHTSEVNELLWEAFLADLRENFRESPHAAEMTLNCLLLLDDADTPLGQRFVKGLVAVRRNRLELGVEATDPLTVVVTSRGELLSDTDDEPDWWRPYTLPDLSESETGAVVSARSAHTDGRTQLIGNHQLTSMVYGFTGGHPASTTLLVEAMSARPLEHGDSLAVLFDHKDLGDRLRRQLLGEFTQDLYEDLVTCAAARTQQHAGLLAAHSELLLGGTNSYEEIVPVLWPPFGGAGPVVLRRLLLRELAARPDDEAASWTKIADWFRTRCADEGDDDGVLHYAMTGGDITATCEGLRKRLAGDPAEWVRLLRSVTSMPRPPSDPATSPMEQLRTTVNARSPRLARLVVALSIAGDPLASNQRNTLHLQIAADYGFVAGLARGDPGPLLTEANRHSKQAELWS